MNVARYSTTQAYSTGKVPAVSYQNLPPSTKTIIPSSPIMADAFNLISVAMAVYTNEWLAQIIDNYSLQLAFF